MRSNATATDGAFCNFILRIIRMKMMLVTSYKFTVSMNVVVLVFIIQRFYMKVINILCCNYYFNSFLVQIFSQSIDLFMNLVREWFDGKFVNIFNPIPYGLRILFEHFVSNKLFRRIFSSFKLEFFWIQTSLASKGRDAAVRWYSGSSND